MKEEWLLKDLREGVATITVNRPEARNALSREMAARLTDYLLESEADREVRCVVLRGGGGHFISGGDVSAFAQTLEMTPTERSSNFRKRVSALTLQMSLLSRFSKPVIAVAEGAIAGAGIAYALAADYLIAASNARFVFAHVRLGLPLDTGLSYYLPRVVGLSRARKLAMTGSTLGAREALDMGMVAEVVEPEELEGALSRIKDQFLSLPPQALAGIKHQLDAAYGNDMAAQVGLEAELVGRCAAEDEFARRIDAFLNR